MNQGCKEIQITAQDTASYGLDTGDNLGDLLSHICKIEKDFRIRVGMMNPFTTQKNLVSIISAYADPKIYKFLHLPVQSGDNDILKKMNRKYNVEDFLTNVCNTISLEKNKKHVGKKYTILTTEKGKNNTYMGRAENYKPVVVNEKVELRKFIPAEIVNSTPTHLFGKLI